VVLFPAVTAAARDRVPGIDVSKYQRRIDWRRVASTNVRFVIMRASLGNDYVDGKYRRNLKGATRHGLVVGAYHFAKPSRGRWDPTAEANHFLRVARNAPGDVLPVLDIEDSGGLGRAELSRWAKRWLRHVEERTGVRPIIYSGNYFWQRYMGNTPWFGRNGYGHWVAHWYVRSPEVPGQHWGGRGWTFWQWSASGRVPGIRGAVDLDWFGGRDLTRGTIASLRVDPAPGGVIAGPMLECGVGRTRCRRLASPGSTITLRAIPEPDAHLERWTGACAPAGATQTCRIRALGALTVSAVFERTPERLAGGEAAPSTELDPEPRERSRGSGRCPAADPRCAIVKVLTKAVDELRLVLPLLPSLGGARGARGTGASAA
jgi:GH25 family lysozyme M1 (1,4-beta-N-acetylmuramidase)